MKKIVIALFPVLLLLSCRTLKQETNTSVKTDSIYIEKLVSIPQEADTAMAQALFECSEDGKVLLRSLDTKEGEKIRLQMKIDSLGHVSFKAINKTDTIYVTNKSVATTKKKEAVQIKEVAIVPQWCKYSLYLNALFILALVVYIWVRTKFKFLRTPINWVKKIINKVS